MMRGVIHTAVAKPDSKVLSGAVARIVNLGKEGFGVIMSEALLSNPIQFARQYWHEVAHANESKVDLGKFSRDSVVAKEAASVKHKEMSIVLGYPLNRTDSALTDEGTTFASELHAQAVALYMSHPDLLKEQMPQTYKLIEDTHGRFQNAGNESVRGTSTGRGSSMAGTGQGVQSEQPRVGETQTPDGRGDRPAEGGAQPEGNSQQKVAPKLPTNQKAFFLNKLKTAQPASPRHGQAIKDALAIISGTKEGDVYAALDKVFSNSEYLGASVAKPEAVENEYDAAEYEGYAEQDLEAFEARMNEGLGEQAPAPVTESSPAQQLQTYLDQHGGKDAFWDGAAKAALKSGDEKRIAGALAAAKKKFGSPVAAASTTAASRPNAQQAKPETLTQAQRNERIAAATAALDKMLGPKIGKMFADSFADGSSGSWTAETTRNVIRIALNGNVMGTAFHESIHELFDILKKNGGGNVIATLEKAAMNPMMQKRLRRALEGHPEAIDQLGTPEEAVAFMFQFWTLDPSGFPLGPQTKSTFEKIKDFLAKVLAVFSEDARNYVRGLKIAEAETQMLEDILGAFSEGALANDATRSAVVSKLASAPVAFQRPRHSYSRRHSSHGVVQTGSCNGSDNRDADCVKVHLCKRSGSFPGRHRINWQNSALLDPAHPSQTSCPTSRTISSKFCKRCSAPVIFTPRESRRFSRPICLSTRLVQSRCRCCPCRPSN